MKITQTELPGVQVIEPRVFGDERGFFLESWNARSFAAAGIEANFVQDNHSRSSAGVLRGLHYQLIHPQGKLVRVISGRAYDVVVDIRRSSPTFGRWTAVVLSAASHSLLWIPPGFAHGFLALEDDTDFIYKCTDFYSSAHERTILWSDPAIGIEWPLAGLHPIVSAKDAAGVPLADAELDS